MKPEIGGVLGYTPLFNDVYVPTKIVFEPSPEYFTNDLLKDSGEYKRLILIHGLEPPLFNNISDLVIENYKLFDEIYSSDEEVLMKCNNSKLFPFGSCWILTDSLGNRVETMEDYHDSYTPVVKIPQVSFINSGKSQLPGHHFRNLISSKLSKSEYDIGLMVPKTRIETKIPLFVNSMYHIAVENSQVRNYFTEKIIDCFMSRTVPIYWGCPNLGNFFNMHGVIKFESISQLDDILKNLTDKQYMDRMEAIEDNYNRAKDYAFFYDRINRILKYEY